MDNRYKMIMEILKKNKWLSILAICLILLLLSFTKTREINRVAPTTYIKTSEAERKQELTKQSEIPMATPEELQQTIQGDSAFNNNVQTFTAKYPWYKEIPIETDKYFIVYDFEERAFRIRVKEGIDINDPEVLKAALASIRNIGADPTSYYMLNP
jgi:hypothetical protein